MSATLPEPARRFTTCLNTSVFCRHQGERGSFHGSKNVTVVPLGEEPGEEDDRDDRGEQYDTRDDACPGRKMFERLHAKSRKLLCPTGEWGFAERIRRGVGDGCDVPGSANGFQV